MIMIRHQVIVTVNGEDKYLTDGVSIRAANLLNELFGEREADSNISVHVDTCDKCTRVKKSNIIVTISNRGRLYNILMSNLDATSMRDLLEMKPIGHGRWVMPTWKAHERGIVLHFTATDGEACKVIHKRLYVRNSFNMDLNKVFRFRNDFHARESLWSVADRFESKFK